jgi:hypothetical protein
MLETINEDYEKYGMTPDGQKNQGLTLNYS